MHKASLLAVLMILDNLAKFCFLLPKKQRLLKVTLTVDSKRLLKVIVDSTRLLRVTLTVDSKRHKGDTNSRLQETVKADSALQETVKGLGGLLKLTVHSKRLLKGTEDSMVARQKNSSSLDRR